MRKLCTAIALITLCACSRQTVDQKSPASVADEASKLAATPEQERLWKEAASRSSQPAVQTPKTEDAVTERQEANVAQGKAAEKMPQIPPNVTGAVIMMDAPPLKTPSYRGAARVASVDGPQVELQLGDVGRIAFVARAAGLPLALSEGEAAQVEYRSQDDPQDRQEILAVKTAAGDGIVSIVDSDTKPVSVTVALYNLVARQVGEARDSTMDVEVRVGNASKVMKAGEVANLGGLTVGLRASGAYQGADVYRIEGNPFTLDLVAWPTAAPSQ